MKRNLFLPVFLAFILASLNGCEYPLIILASAVLHELAHVAVAWLCGAKMHLSRFLPVGLVLEYDCHLIHPAKEAAVASAGIIANAVASVVIASVGDMNEPAVFFAFSANAVLAIMNLLPLSALDGYVIADSLLSLITEPNKAMRIADTVSDFGTVAFVVFCLWFNLKIGVNPSLAVISLFLCFSLLKPDREHKKPHVEA